MNQATLRRLLQTPLRDLLQGRGLTGRMDWEHTLATCALPAGAQVRIAETVKRTKLWRMEKAQVCDELIAHFQERLDAGESAEEWVANFGDTKQAAKLIRREKKKLRPLWWHVTSWISNGVLVIFALHGIMLLYYTSGTPVIKTDYWAQLNATTLATPESERAWPIYREALLGIPELREDEKFNEDSKPLNFAAAIGHAQDLSQKMPEWGILERGLQAHDKELARLREGARKKVFGYEQQPGGAWAPADEPLFGKSNSDNTAPNELYKILATSSRHFSYSGQIACLFFADMKLAAAQTDFNRVVLDLQASLSLSKQVHNELGVMAQLTGSGIYAGTLHHLGTLLDQPALANDASLKTLATLTSQDPPPFRFQGERLLLHAFVERMYTDDGAGDGRLIHNPQNNFFFDLLGYQWGIAQKNSAKHTLTMLFLPILADSRKEVLDKGNAWLDRMEHEVQLPPWETKAPEGFFDFRRNTASTQATHSALQLGIALHRHKLAHGAFPAQLADLVPAYLKELPVDPITGGPLHYRLDAKGNPIAYSVGTDHNDDGGFAPVNKAGEADNNTAQRWLTPEELKKGIAPKGDWILWPMSALPLMPKP